jgi:acyl-CoA reductase-like NAD-dependent aldehyde dehydrogenase
MPITHDLDTLAGVRSQIDRTLERLRDSRDRWAKLPLRQKVLLLDDLRRNVSAVAPEWAAASALAKSLDLHSPAAGEEWLTVAILLRGLRMRRDSLADIAEGRPPHVPGPIRPLSSGGLRVRVLPGGVADRILFSGVTAEIWTEPDVTPESLARESLSQAIERPGKTTLVFGAGNASPLGPLDAVEKLFRDHAVVAYKSHPVLEYLTPLVERVFRSLIDEGYFAVVPGGIAEGAYLASHPLVDELHLTGSARTYDAIVFGPGEEGVRRKAARVRLNSKPFTCELGSVSPVIVVPGPWSSSDVAYQGEHLAAMLVVNAGFNCLATRVIVQHDAWAGRHALLNEVRRVLTHTPTRAAYYPGAQELHQAFVDVHPEAEFFGKPSTGALPWTLIAGLDPSHEDDPCFKREAFGPLFAETALEAADVPQFLERAVRFVNDVLWGSLTATILVHPASLRDPSISQAVESAIGDLQYGTVGVNLWGAMNWATMSGSWGAFPGHPFYDIGSGTGTVANFRMVPRPRKTVIRGPFRQRPKPASFPSHRTRLSLGKRLAAFEAAPSPLKLAGVVAAAIRG